MYNRNGSLKHMVSKIRRDPQAFERYQHNRDLVTLVNLFADSLRDLPRGWETKFDRNGKVKGFINLRRYYVQNSQSLGVWSS